MAHYVADGLRRQGHHVQEWSARSDRPQGYASKSKWVGYIDQFLFFTLWMWCQVRRQPRDTVYFFIDQALSPWIWCVGNRPHVLQINDLLAVRSARGDFPQNPTRFSGRLYQAVIVAGLRRARHFIAISESTRIDLLVLTKKDQRQVERIYVGLNHPYCALSKDVIAKRLQAASVGTVPEAGYIFHVGGNQWYKNRQGVLMLYRAYVEHHGNPPELWIAGTAPSADSALLASRIKSLGGVVRFFQGVDNETLNAMYSGARLMLFPSIAEGFGWPIAEAMASGCPVLTTKRAPMTEVGGAAAFYIDAMPDDVGAHAQWQAAGAGVINEALVLSADDREHRISAGYRQVEQFATAKAIERYAELCQRLLENWRN